MIFKTLVYIYQNKINMHIMIAFMLNKIEGYF